MQTHAHTHTLLSEARVSSFIVVTKGDNLPPDPALIHTAAVIVNWASGLRLHSHKKSYQHLGRLKTLLDVLCVVGCVVQVISNPWWFNMSHSANSRCLNYAARAGHFLGCFFFCLFPLHPHLDRTQRKGTQSLMKEVTWQRTN